MEQQSNSLDECLRQIKAMTDQLQNDKSYQKYGYILKQDLIDVYKNKKKEKAKRKENREMYLLEEQSMNDSSSDDSADDLLLLI